MPERTVQLRLARLNGSNCRSISPNVGGVFTNSFRFFLLKLYPDHLFLLSISIVLVQQTILDSQNHPDAMVRDFLMYSNDTTRVGFY
ncbi:MAG: hypothetical protein C5B52_02700 [Bacteroidetes bacterium]|nr:MAG: hypothetical protein C5B52_02700 [Bacteroidota bacterium]